MPRMTKITQKTLEAIGTDRDGKTIRDDGNLIGEIRAKKNGTVTVFFNYRYRFDGRSKDFSCGCWPRDSLSSIRSNRDAARLQTARGIDPAVHKKIKKEDDKVAVAAKLEEIERQKNENKTVQDMVDAWLKDGVRRHDQNAELKRSFSADVLPKIGKKSVRELTEHDLRDVLQTLVARGVNRSAVIMRNNLAQLFAWAKVRQPWRKLMVEGNPMDLIDIELILPDDYDFDNVRERVLLDEEIRELRNIFKKMQDDYKNAKNKFEAVRPLGIREQCKLWIMLSTMCRVGETSMARWEHVNFEARTWFIPEENTKEKESELIVYLSDFTIEQFRKLHEISGASEWCFPSKNNESHSCVKSTTKQVGDRQAMFQKNKDGKPRAQMKNRRLDNTLVLSEGANGKWTPHDLRRTGVTIMQRLEVSLDVIDRCQNHVLSGSKKESGNNNRVRRHYMHYKYETEMRDAWRKLGAQLTQILSIASVNAVESVEKRATRFTAQHELQ